MKPEITPAVLNQQQAASYLGISTDTLWRLRCARKIPSVLYPSGKPKFLRRDLDRWLEDRRIVTKADEARLKDGRRS